MKRIGIMGGTFDPIHLGHLVAAECAREASLLDEVWFMPACLPPHKSRQPFATVEQRLAMTRLAVQANPYFWVSDWEAVRNGVSYTMDTILGLWEMYPGIEWSWIIGGDMFAYLPRWHRIAELVERVSFIGVHRPGTPWQLDKLPTAWREHISVAYMPQLEISSTLIRQRQSEGKTIRYFVPIEVEQYITRWGLYETST